MALGIDVETCLISPGLLAPPLVCVSWCQGQDRGVIDHLTAHSFVRQCLEARDLILGLNIAYDMAVLGNEYPDLLPLVFEKYWRGEIRDVGLDQRLIDIAAGKIKFYDKKKGAYSLAGLCDRLLGVTLAKEDTPRLEYGALRGVPVSEYTPEQLRYAELDAVYPVQIHEHQLGVDEAWRKKHKVGLFADAPAQARHAFSLHLLSCWGVRADEGRCKALLQSLEREIAEARALLQTHGLVRENGTRDIKAAQARMLEVMSVRGLKPLLTPKNGIKLDQEATDLSGDEVLKAYTRFVGANGLRQKVRDLWRGAYVPLQPRYRSLMDTGRTSSSKPRPPASYGFQLQNPPRLGGARECLEPRPGYIFIDADFTTAEVHSLAQTLLDVYGKSQLAELLQSGKDTHCYVAAKLLGKTYEEVDQAPKKQRREWRNFAKAFVFGAPGGLAHEKFSKYAFVTYGVEMPPSEAKGHLHTFKQRLFPDIGRYLSDIGVMMDRRDLVLYPWVNRWRGGLTFTNCANGYFQARTADAALAALDRVVRLAYTDRASPLWGCRFHGFIHDEIRGEAPVGRAAEAAEELGRVMAEEYNKFTPDVPTVAEPGLCWRWSKGADPVRNEQGILVPSDPENAPAWYTNV